MKTTSNTNYHIDRSIILFFIGVIIISASVFGYRLANHTPCDIVDFSFDSSSLRVGEIIRFKDKTKGIVNEREWDFGDSTKIDTRIAPFHTYEHPGQYTVRLRINGNCEGITQTLTIKEKAFVLDSTKLARFKVPVSIEVGKELRIKDETKNARTWEWRFGETADVNSTDKNPKYVYKTPGLKTITLIVNGDVRYGTKKKINVLPKPSLVDNKPVRRVPRNSPKSTIPYAPTIGVAPISDKPKETKAPFIGLNKLKEKLLLVADEKQTAKNFNEYLCGNLNLSIVVNRKKTTFIEFCQRIKGKGIKIKELEIVRAENNCIKNLVIRYSKTGLF
ncbi:PKD domain-containing protein [Aquimarina hainanensis]|uniref:PKD domain-containing protein n=1 Tax=Aquimarina hainanensis TaxID=1578017 RepID=A0ABW5NDZ8_9FLAO|nr:PKD domain-containing protein [Aquimarina sp. TRL1]QKX07176.1 hypothetical protein HN014_20405 [Aquimarina sp. TRL1]